MRRTDTGEVAATTVITAVHLDTRARKATAFPAEIRARAQALCAAASDIA
jgi:acyl-CoA thioesterase FadM